MQSSKCSHQQPRGSLQVAATCSARPGAAGLRPPRPRMGRHRALPAGAPSPWEELARMEQQMDAMQRAMDSSFGSSFGNIDRFERQMDEEMRAMDQHMYNMRQRINDNLERSMGQLQDAPPGVHIERSEQRAPGSYRFYESISIRSGVSVASVPTTPLAPAHALGPSPLLIAAMVLAGAGAAVAAAFNRNFDCTTYSRKSRVELTLLLPFLAAFSKRFRQQLASALRGVPYEVTEDGRLAPPAQQHRMQQGGQPASRRAAASTENEMKA